jgi:hypothetical protein
MCTSTDETAGERIKVKISEDRTEEQNRREAVCVYVCGGDSGKDRNKNENRRTMSERRS